MPMEFTSPPPPPAGATSTATTAGARTHARAQAGARAEAMRTVPAASATQLPDGVTAESVVWDETVAGGGYAHCVLSRGTEVRLTDLDGDACANLLLFDAHDPSERLNVADTVKVQWQAYLGPGTLLLSDRGRVLASVVDDTSGTHDALCGSSTRMTNEARYGAGGAESASPSARDLFTLALAKHDLTPRDIAPSVSLFKGVRIDEHGSLQFLAGAGAGRSLTLRCEHPVLLVIANTAHPLDARTAFTVSPLRITAWAGQPTDPGDARWSATPEGERAFLNTADHLTARGDR